VSYSVRYDSILIVVYQLSVLDCVSVYTLVFIRTRFVLSLHYYQECSMCNAAQRKVR
jgi:hypothetical protein